MYKFIFIFIALLGLAGCSTKKEAVESGSADTQSVSAAEPEKIQLMSEFSNTKKKMADAKIEAIGEKVNFTLSGRGLSKGFYNLVLAKSNCETLQKNHVRISEADLKPGELEIVGEFKIATLSSPGVEFTTKDSVSGKEYLADRVFAIYKPARGKKNPPTYSFVACEKRL